MKTGMFKKFFTARNKSLSIPMKIGRFAVCAVSTVAACITANKFTANNGVKGIIADICIILTAIWFIR